MIYSLHELDSDKIFTGELNVNDTTSLMFVTASKNSMGMIVLDNNTDLSNTRSFINLQTKKTTKQKFNKVIDTEFKEFVKPVGDPTIFLKNKIAGLQNQIEKLLAVINQDDVQIKALQSQIQSLTRLLGGGNAPSGLQEQIKEVTSTAAVAGSLQGTISSNTGNNAGGFGSITAMGEGSLQLGGSGTTNSATNIDPVVKYIFNTDAQGTNGNQFIIYVNGTPKMYITKSNLSGSFSAKNKDAISVKSITTAKYNSTFEIYDDVNGILINSVDKVGSATLTGTDVFDNKVYRLNGTIEIA